MAITSAIVLYAVIWFMLLLITLPIGLKTQGDMGDVVPGTHAGAPADVNIKRRFKLVSIGAIFIWAIVAGIIIFGNITVCDFDWFNRMECGPGSVRGG